jgi:hypothetical protein
MTPVNRIDVLEKELARLLEWVRASESRLALVLPLSTAMLGALAVLAPAANKWTVFTAVTSSFASLFLSLSMVFSACASFPRTSGPKGSVIYFGGVVDRDLVQYEKAMRDLQEEDYIQDLARQCHRNAQIAVAKYSWTRRAIACLFFGTGPWAIALFLLYRGR